MLRKGLHLGDVCQDFIGRRVSLDVVYFNMGFPIIVTWVTWEFSCD